MNTFFWNSLKKPIIGLSPMDGVTDAAFRFVADKYGKPSVLLTEFTNVEGIVRGVTHLMQAFIHHKTDTPTVAQIFGTEVDAFYKSAFALCEMGFSGIDINMGCPDKHIAKKGGGAGLILQPKKAQKIIKEIKRAITEWRNGRTLEEVGLHENIIYFVREFQKKTGLIPKRKLLPVSVKTRIGYDKIVTPWWIQTLLDAEPVAISVHGRTLEQLYTGYSNWEEIGKAATLAHKTETILLGNGDIRSLIDAHQKIKKYGTDGALIGRAAFGNPWVFTDKIPTTADLFTVLLEQCEKFYELTPSLNFLTLRKHMVWYSRGFDHAAETRSRLMKASNVEDVRTIVTPFLTAMQAS